MLRPFAVPLRNVKYRRLNGALKSFFHVLKVRI
jgi:hypothetical protein